MKSLSLFSAVVITALISTACSEKKSAREALPAAAPEQEKAVLTEEGFVDSLTTGSWVSGCDQDQKRVRLEFQKSTNIMVTYDESCSRGERNAELEGTKHWYELTSFDGESMHLQISSVRTERIPTDKWVTLKDKNLQAFSVKVAGDKLSFVGLLPEGVSFPMSYTRVNPPAELLY